MKLNKNYLRFCRWIKTKLGLHKDWYYSCPDEKSMCWQAWQEAQKCERMCEYGVHDSEGHCLLNNDWKQGFTSYEVDKDKIEELWNLWVDKLKEHDLIKTAEKV